MDFAGQFAADGWLKLGGLFDPQLIDAVREEFEGQLADLTEHKGGFRSYIAVGDKRMMLPVRLTGALADPRVYANPLLVTMLRHLLGQDFLIDNVTCVVSLPDAQPQRPHRDHPELFADAQSPLPFAVTLAVPLVDLTEETGTTRILAGSNRGAGDPVEVLPYLKRGDCFLMDYRTEHQGMGNRSADNRPVLFIIYARYWFIDVRNFRRQARINMSRSDLEKIPVEHQYLFRRLAAKGAFDASQKELFPDLEEPIRRTPTHFPEIAEPPRD
jgi:hypothetical protein